MKKTLTLLITSTALTAVIAIPAWSAMSLPSDSVLRPMAALWSDAQQSMPLILASGESDDDSDDDSNDDDSNDDDSDDDDSDDDNDDNDSNDDNGRDDDSDRDAKDDDDTCDDDGNDDTVCSSGAGTLPPAVTVIPPQGQVN